MSNGAPKPTIHILGGGPSGLSTAFHLTSPTTNPDWQDRYNVVIYQMGWRLGGKGATGRNADAGGRIQEHGIHLFANMYANALHMMSQTLDELPKTGRTRTMATEFLPSNFQMVPDFYDGRWHGFEGELPHNDEVPWDVHSDLADPEHLVQSVFNTVSAMLEGDELPVPGHRPTVHLKEGLLARFVSWFVRLLGRGGVGVLSHLRGLLTHEIENVDSPHDLESALGVLERILEAVDGFMAGVQDVDDRLHWIFLQLDLLTTSIRGAVADGVFTAGIDVVDDRECHQWLRDHGARDVTLASSIINAIPNTCMQYPDGDSTVPPTMSAAGYLTFMFRQMMAPGQAAYSFRAGTGDTVILPIYQVLVERGVQFEFFHKIHQLTPAADGKRIESFTVERQATTTSGSYDPLITLPDGERAWPSEPRFEQLTQGDELKDRGIDLESWWADWKGPVSAVELGPDDQVVVALPPAVQKLVCADAADAAARRGEPGWATMLAEVKTSATQAVQIWLNRTPTELGWPRLGGTNRVIGPTYTGPIPAFSDFSDLINEEDWPDGDRPKGLIYFCGPLQDPVTIPEFDDHDFPEQQRQRVKHMAAQYLRTIGGLLPYGGGDQVDEFSLDFSLLHCYDESTAGSGENRVDQQYYRANIDPNERFTLSVPGTLQYRLKAWESGFENCALSTDAIYTGFNLGSFEGAVMGGMLASLTVSGAPKLDDIYGYQFLHPDTPRPPDPFLSQSDRGGGVDLRDQIDVRDTAAEEAPTEPST